VIEADEFKLVGLEAGDLVNYQGKLNMSCVEMKEEDSTYVYIAEVSYDIDHPYRPIERAGTAG